MLKLDINRLSDLIMQQALSHELDVHAARLFMSKEGKYFLHNYGLGGYQNADPAYVEQVASSLDYVIPQEMNSKLFKDIMAIINNADKTTEEKTKSINIMIMLGVARNLHDNITKEIHEYRMVHLLQDACEQDVSKALHALNVLKEVGEKDINFRRYPELEVVVQRLNTISQEAKSGEAKQQAVKYLSELKVLYDEAMLGGSYFNPEEFERRKTEYKNGEISTANSVIDQSRLSGYSREDVNELPEEGSAAYKEDQKTGEGIIGRGELAVLAMNGGIATRFRGTGSGVKGLFPVLELHGKEMSFIEIKMRHALATAKRYGGKIPQVLLDSYFTDKATRACLEMNDYFGTDGPFAALRCGNRFTHPISVRLPDRDDRLE